MLDGIHDPKNPQSIGGNEIIFTGQDRSGVLWIGLGNGLDRFDRATGKVTMHIPLPQSRLLFHEDRFGVFWLTYGADRTLATLDRKTGTLTRYPIKGDALSDTGLDWVMGMYEDRDGTMWFATRRNGLLKYDRSGNRFIRYRHYREDDGSIAADRVTAIYQDREGNFWIGPNEAPPNFFVSHPPLFEDLTQATEAEGGAARRTVIYEDRERVLWIGSEGALWSLRRDSEQSAEPDSDLSSVVSIAEQGTTLWFAGNAKGLFDWTARPGRTRSIARTPGLGVR